MKDEVKGKAEGRKGEGFHPLTLTLLPFACSLSSFRLHPSSLQFNGFDNADPVVVVQTSLRKFSHKAEDCVREATDV